VRKGKKKRVVVKDPNKPKPKPWTESELAHFRHLVSSQPARARARWQELTGAGVRQLDTEGANQWALKAVKLGTGRTAKSLHTRWLRDEGRIVDKPRGMGETSPTTCAPHLSDTNRCCSQPPC